MRFRGIRRRDNFGSKTVNLPRARPDSGFALLVRSNADGDDPGHAGADATRTVGERDTRLWRVHHYVDQARARADASSVTRVAIDAARDIPNAPPSGRLR